MKQRLFQLMATVWSSKNIAKANTVIEPTGMLLQTADALRDSGNAAEAAEAYNKALILSPGRGDIWVQLGNMLKDSSQFAAAEAAYRSALALSDQADTHLQLGHLFKMVGNRAQAVTEYRRAVELEPDLLGGVQELAEAGERSLQDQRFRTRLRDGDVDAMLTVTNAIANMQAELDRLSRALPEAQAQTAFPIALYASFRDVFPVPSAPGCPPLDIHIVLLAEREDVASLFGQVGAIQAQSCGGWTLSVLGHSTERRQVIDLAAVSDPRIRWVDTGGETNLARAEQLHARTITDDWLLLLAAGAMLDPQALAWFAAAAAWSKAVAFITDEETGIRRRGRVEYSSPVLRQVVDFDSLLEANVFGDTIALRSNTYREAATALPDTEVAAARTALLLILSSASQVGHVPYPLVWRSSPAAAVAAEYQEGVTAYLSFAGLADRLDRRGTTPMWRSQQPQTAIAVFIPTRDNAGDLENFVRSLQRTAAAPEALEITVIDNGSALTIDPQILQGIAPQSRIQVLRHDEPFNWSHLNNEAVRQTQAPLLLFANDDMQMISAGWDARLRGLLEREDVGAVGARLLYNDDTVQHAGVLMGWKGSVIHDGLFEAADTPGPTARWQMTRAVSAVTGAFLATRRERFIQLDGFDEIALPVAYSDIDFALRLRSIGLKVLWTPAITLYHHESKTRGLDHTDNWRAARNASERAAMDDRWGAVLDRELSVHPFWHSATLPFRLITSPSFEKVREHIVQTGSTTPWMVSRTPTTPHRPRQPR
jgi:GT2 family glycosyltransferase/Tfp pilus assembly protein PilF